MKIKSVVSRLLGVAILLLAVPGAVQPDQSALAARPAVSPVPQDPPPPQIPAVTVLPPIGGLSSFALRDLSTGGLGPAREPESSMSLQTQESELTIASLPSATTFDGLDSSVNSSSIWPPDAVGDVGPNHYVQLVNQAIGIYSKAGVLLQSASLASIFTASPGAICAVAANHQGNPTILYDAGYDRWVLTDFAWALSSDRALCIAVSNSGDPTGTWIRYQITLHPTWVPRASAIGLWTDGVFMSIDMWDGSTFNGTRVWAFDRAELYGGAPSTFYVDLPTQYRSLLPANFRGASPPVGTPEYLAAADQATSTLNIWKFAMNWTTEAGILTGPTPVTVPAYSPPPATISQMAAAGGDLLDSQGDRLMMQNQYRNLGGTESLWLAHTVGNGGTPNIAGIRWYQLDVTGQGVDSAPVQSGTYQPDSSHRWIPSLAVDGIGDMAVGYSVSSGSMYPEIRYAGRLVTDSPGTLGLGEGTFFAGSGAQSGAGGTWGTHSSMTVDPSDDCTFWYTDMYYETTGSSWKTRFGSFSYPECISSALVQVSIGGALQGNYVVSAGGLVSPSYPGVFDGPVNVKSLTTGEDILTSQRMIYNNGVQDTLGFPAPELTTEYWFPWYDFTQVSTWIVIGNTSSVDPADVEIYIGGAFKEGKTIEPDGQWAPAYPGEFNGPVQVKSTNGVPILVSQRMLYNGGLQETLGFPATQLTTEYWYSWYDFTAMSTWIVIGNTSSVDSADVEIYIGGALKESKTIAANGQWAPAYPGEFDGPVQVKSTNGVKILTSQRAVYNGRLNETLGLPANQLTSDYWYTLYDGTAMSTWIVVGNTSSIDMADVEIYIAGALVGSQAIDPNGQWAPAYVGVLDGPVEVKSTNGVKIFTSQRLLYNNYFKESPGYPAPQLTTDYWFPWYDYTEISSWILIARP